VLARCIARRSVAAEPTRRPVVVRPAAAHLRRVLDAGSWVLLEELLARSVGDTESSVTTASIRDLAGSLGVAKDTIGRDVARLRSHGLLTVAQSRAGDGVFSSTSYRISVPADMFDLTADAMPAAVADVCAATPASRSAKRSHAVDDSQLSLLDV
jgi:hypothetical protein